MEKKPLRNEFINLGLMVAGQTLPEMSQSRVCWPTLSVFNPEISYRLML